MTVRRWMRQPFWDACGAMYFAARCVLPYKHEGWHFYPERGEEVYDMEWVADGISWADGSGVPANPFISQWEIDHQEEY